jgi:TetR/AcrR family transcriptional regulator
MHRRDAHQPNGVERLLAAARRLFARRGFFGVSVEDLVQAAAVTRPVLYYHFHSKEGLYAAACERAAAEYEAAIESAACGGGGVVERIRRVCAVQAVAMREAILLAEAAVRRSGARCEHPADPEIGVRRSKVVEVLRALIAEGIRAAEFAECDPESTALALAGAATTAAWLETGSGEASGRSSINGVLAVVLRGLTPAVTV